MITSRSFKNILYSKIVIYTESHCSLLQIFAYAIINANHSTARRKTMKHSKTCPKCQSNDLLIVNGYAGAYGSGNNILVGATIFSAIKVDRYICCKCGFTEEWIEDGGIEKLKKSKKAHR